MTTTSETKTKSGQEIIEGLAVSLKLSQDLLASLHEESKALRTMSTQELFRISHQKDVLLSKIHYLDDALQSSFSALRKDPASTSLTPEQSSLIDSYKTKITNVRQEIQTKNTINKRFTEDTLRYLSDAIALITRPAEADNTYRIPGRSLARGKNMPSYISCGV
ncbi:MAG: flagellar protein FlgN [Desulfobulbaceae bacterium]|nr:flagellar protein FlgN [Desulfobulbaceae bacterium]